MFILYPLIFKTNLYKAIYLSSILLIPFLTLDQKIKINHSIMRALLFQFFMILLSILITVINSFSREDIDFPLIVKTLYYLSNPIVFILVGILIAKYLNIFDLLKIIIYSGSLGGFIMAANELIKYGPAILKDPFLARSAFSCFFILNVLTIIILIYSSEYNINLINNSILRYLLIIVNFITLYLSSSRIYYLGIILMDAVFLLIRRTKGVFVRTVAQVFVVITFIFILKNSLFFEKWTRIKTEAGINNYFSEQEINVYYRAFESYTALNTYIGGNIINLLFGFGLEKQVELGTLVKLGDRYWNEVPMIHNGYLYLLLHEGIIGLTGIIILLFLLFKFKPMGNKTAFIWTICLASMLILCVSNYFISSFFTAEMSILWIIIGYYFVIYEEASNKMLRERKSIIKK